MRKTLLIVVSMLLALPLWAQVDTVQLPLREDFDSVTDGRLPDGWHGVGPTWYSTAYPCVDNSGAVTIWSNADTACTLTTPVLRREANRLTIRFTLQMYSLHGRFEVGLASDTAGLTDYTPVRYITTSSTQPITYEVDTWQASQSGMMRVVFRTIGNGTRFSLDDVEIVAGGSCAKSYDVHLEYIDSTSAQLSWRHDGGENGYLLTLDDTHTYNLTDTTLLLDSLLPNTEYTVGVSTLCPLGDTTVPAVFSFHTLCYAIDVPYVGSFTRYDNGGFPDCWHRTSGTFYLWPCVGNNHSLNMLSSPDNPQIVSTAPINHDPRRLHVRFRAHVDMTTTLEGGIILDMHDSSTFIPMITIEGDEMDTTIHTYDFYTDGYNLTEPVSIAFRALSTSQRTASLYTIYIMHADSCHQPSVPRITAVGGNAISIEWAGQSIDSAGFEVRFSTTDTLPDDGDTLHRLFVDSNAVTLNNLRFNAPYYIWVRSLCMDGGTPWLAFPMVRTSCGEETLPFIETFESYTVEDTPPCWDYAHSNGAYTTLPYIYESVALAHSGDKSLIISTYLHDTIYAIAPQMPTGAADMHVSFWVSKSRGTFEAGLMRMRDSLFIPFFTDSVNSILTPYFHDFYTNTITTTEAMRVAFRWTPPRNIGSLQNWYLFRAYLDDVRITNLGSCQRPDSVRVDTATFTSATGQVFDHTDNNYYRLIYSDGRTTDSMDITTHYFTLDSLRHSTRYTLKTISVCYDGTTTDTVETVFNTACQTITHADLPYTEDFDSYPTSGDLYISPCWQKISTSIFPLPANTGLEGNVALQFFTTNNIPQYQYAIQYAVLPEMDYVNDLYVEFDYKADNICTLEVGVMDDPAITGTFTAIDQIVIASPITNMIRRHVLLNNYSGTGRYIAFRMGNSNGTPYSNTSLYIDNIFVDTVQNCPDSAYNFVADDVATGMATLSWNISNGNAEQAHFVIHLLDNTGTELDTFGTSITTYSISDLLPSTAYGAYVEMLCHADSSFSYTTDTIQFLTMCELAEDIYVSNYDSSSTTMRTYMLPAAISSTSSTTYQVFTSEDIESLPGEITSISIKNFNGQGTVGTIQCRISIGHYQSDTVVWNSLPTDLQLCYSGPLRARNGWSTYTFTTPFHYNGHDNLIVSFSSWGELYGLPAIYSSAANTLYHGVSYVEYYTRSSTSQDSLVSSVMTLRNLLKFNLCPTNESLCNPPTIDSVSHDDNSITVHYTTPHDGELYITRGWWNRGVSGEVDNTGSYIFSGLNPSTVYTVGVRQRCPYGQVSMWTLRRITTDSISSVFDLLPEVSELGMRSATIAWNSPDTEGLWEAHLFNTMTDITETTRTPQVTFDGLTSGSTYSVTVREFRGTALSIPSAWSDTISFTTKVCMPVSNLTANSVDNHHATLQWDDPNEGAYKWRIEYGLEGFSRGEAIGSFTILENPYTLSGLSSGTTYEIYVAAACDAQNSVWSTPLTITTTGQTGIAAASTTDALRVYPNPTTGTVTINTDNYPALMTVVDMSGREVMHRTIDGQQTTVDLRQLDNGTYFIKVASQQNMLITKIIKQ